MKQNLVSFLYQENVRSTIQVATALTAVAGTVLFVYFFIIFFWAAFTPL